MIGDWLTAAARRILHDETFALVAAPAIADLQFRSAVESRAELIKSYVAVLATLSGAISHDLALDLAGIFSRGARREVWPRALEAPLIALVLSMMVMFWGIASWFDNADAGPDGFAMLTVLLIPFAVATAAPLAALSFASVMASSARRDARRLALAWAFVLLLPLTLLSYMALPRMDATFLEIRIAAGMRQESRSQQPLWQVWTERKREIEEWIRPDGAERRGDGGRRTAYAATVFAFTLAGLALRQRRRSSLILAMAGAAAAQYVLYGIVRTSTLPVSPAWKAWLATLMLTLLAAAFYALRQDRRSPDSDGLPAA